MCSSGEKAPEHQSLRPLFIELISNIIVHSGQASSENAKAVGMLAESMAKTGWKLACKETGPSNGGGGVGVTKPTKRLYSTSTQAETSGN